MNLNAQNRQIRDNNKAKIRMLCSDIHDICLVVIDLARDKEQLRAIGNLLEDLDMIHELLKGI